MHPSVGRTGVCRESLEQEGVQGRDFESGGRVPGAVVDDSEVREALRPRPDTGRQPATGTIFADDGGHVGAQKNREIVARYFEIIGGGGDVREVFAEAIRWNLPRTNPMGTPMVGLESVLAMLGEGIDLYDATQMHTEIHTVVADDDHVAVRLTFHTRTRAGTPYDGDYQFIFAVDDGRITEIWEQPDTLYQERMGVFTRA